MIGLIISYILTMIYLATSESRKGSVKGDKIMRWIMMGFFTCVFIQIALQQGMKQ